MPSYGKGAGRPPRVQFALAVGITGHRSEVLSDAAQLRLAGRLDALLIDLRDAAVALHASHAACFADSPPRFRMVSALADGADQLGANGALGQGFDLHAVLPFARDVYQAMLPPGNVAMAGLLDRAAGIIELSGDAADPLEAFVTAGRVTVAHCDVLVAVWDGLAARGPGGTAEIVALAVRNGTPIIHIPVDDSAACRLIWGGYDRHIVHARIDDVPQRDADRTQIELLLAQVLCPPDDAFERACLMAFYGERQRRVRLRLEYQLMLALTGAGAIKPGHMFVTPYAQETRSQWAGLTDAVCAGCERQTEQLDGIEAAFSWSDGLARHFAQSYRSGHVFNFTLAAAAVLIALSGLLFAEVKVWLAVAELAAVVAFVVNTRVGNGAAWQRRWLDYRQLAERLRPMRSLKLLAAAQPEPCPIGSNRYRWTDWYAARLWQSDGCAGGRIATADVETLSAIIVAEELRPQIAYHRDNARQTHHLDHRLHQTGTALFLASILSCLVLIVMYVVDHDWVTANAALFVCLSAGLPAAGSAIFGIRVQGDFRATADRSLATAQRLDAIARRMPDEASLLRLCDLTEAAARAMVNDLVEWRLSNIQRRLEIPG